MKSFLWSLLGGVIVFVGNNPATAQTKWTPDSTLRIMKKVADWQLKSWQSAGMHFPKWDWTNAAAYTGYMALNEVANDPKYIKFLYEIGEDVGWNTGPRRFFGDDYCIAQTFAQLYELYQQPKMLARFIPLADSILSQPHTESLEWKNSIQLREWAWCDALFMAPPALAYLSTALKDQKYIDAASRLWWRTTDYLFDSTENLYYRDSKFFGKKEANGQKVFWSRGNGWVMAGLVRMLENMPANYHGRGRFEDLFKRMATRIASLQCADGSWHASLLDPDSYPAKETSGTGFYCYALAYGVNHNLLPYEKFNPVIEKAWEALVTSVHKNGKLGNVQQIGEKPESVDSNSTEVYGTGGFLLAGTEMIKLQLKHSGNKNILAIINPISTNREESVVEMTYVDFIKKYSPKKNLFKITNALTGKEIPYQMEYRGNKSPQNILLLVNLAPGATVFAEVSSGEPEKTEPLTFARFVPERYDDFAWENDKIAFRVYGKALEKTKENAYGQDVWAKRTSKLIINDWYRTGDYHTDHGEGLDFYSVGFTLGDGSNAPFIKDSIYYSKNFRSYKILDNGPLRSSFELTYDEWNVDGKLVKETKTFSLDAGSQLNKISTIYSFSGKDRLPVAIGIVKRKAPGVMLMNEEKGVMGYWEPKHGKDGTIGTGVVVLQNDLSMAVKDGHLLSLTSVDNQKPLVYYSGAAWDKAGRIKNDKEWFDYLTDFNRSIANPALVKWF